MLSIFSILHHFGCPFPPVWCMHQSAEPWNLLEFMAALSFFISSLVWQCHGNQVHLLNVFRMSALHDLSALYLKKLCQTFQVFANIVMFISKQDPNAGYPAGRLRNQKASLYNMLLPVNKQAGNKTWQHRLRGKKLNKILKMQTSVAEETKHEAWGEWSRKTMLGPWQISMLPKYSWC